MLGLNRIVAYLMISFSLFLGGGSLLALIFFMVTGKTFSLNLEMEGKALLILDGVLSLLFFIQHSFMVRKRFKEWITRRINPVYYSALFSIASGLALFTLLLFWQKSEPVVFISPDWLVWVSHAAFLFSIIGFIWGIRSLGSFDPFGLGSIRRALKGKTTRPSPFIIKGPYQYVRHPLYSFFILMIWSHPHLTPDRLLFNLCWTLWIIIGSYWEEKDLVSVFGEAYLDYRKRVPNLIPVRLGKGLFP